MAIDVGLKRIGLAFGFGEVVTPLEPVLRKNRNQAARDVSQKVNEYAPNTLVVGVPIGGSSEASEIYINTKRDGRLDSVSATIILKRYLKIL